MVKPWAQFEVAVANVLRSLDPSARVTHDAYIPDIDTGEPRQRDVWIETSFGGHIRIKILVSCKRTKSKVSQQDMDAFIGELRSSGAQKGVLYSLNGFSGPAIKKAEKIGISCCLLFEKAPPQVPNMVSAYLITEYANCTLDPAPLSPGVKFSEILGQKIDFEGAQKTVIDIIQTLWARDSDELIANIARVPDVGRIIDVPVALPCGDPANLRVESVWVAHRAKSDGFIIDGSYAMTERNIKGGVSLPAIGPNLADPGPGWEKVAAIEVRTAPMEAKICYPEENIERMLRQTLSEHPDARFMRPG